MARHPSRPSRPSRARSRLASLGIDQLEPRRVCAATPVSGSGPLVLADHVMAIEVGPVAAAVVPTVLFTESDFDRMRAGVNSGAEPFATSWAGLQGDGYSQLGWAGRPLATVIRGGTGENFNQMVIDIQRTYQLALRWKISGDTRYADAAVHLLNVWASTNTTLTGNADRFLASGLYAFDWAAAADIMKSYSGWAAADVAQFQNYLLNVYYPLQHQFLTGHNGASITNYWANWDLANVEGMMAVGVFTGRQDIYDEGFTYLFTGKGNGALDKAFYFLHPGNLYQWQESGRDQGHTLLGMALFGHIAQMAWNQGYDLFAFKNYQFLAAAEYIAKYNLGEDVPYQPYFWGTGVNGTWSSQPGVSAASRGNGGTGYALIYSHYVERLGMAAPYTTRRVQALGPEGRNNGDDMGFGTLTSSRTPVAAAGLVPRGLTAIERGRGTVQLDWFGTMNATGYDVHRAASAGGPFTKIASNVTGLLTFTDWGLAPGTYFYKVAGITSGGATGFSAVVSATATSDLVVQLPFNEGTGTSAADATGSAAAGTLTGGATWAAGTSGSAVNLDGSSGHVSLPPGITASLADFTIAAWVNLDAAGTWSRIFDFGDDRGNWMFLTPKNGGGVLEFATSTVYGYDKQKINGTLPLPTGQWVHVAVTLSGTIGTLYVNGAAVGTTGGMTLPPFQIGATTRNWIGRSQFSADPYLDGRVDDFRIYRGGLLAGEVYALATGLPAPTPPAAPASLTATAAVGNVVNLSWSAVPGATGYTIRRSPAVGGPYETLATLVKGSTYADTGLTAGTTFFYTVAAANTGGDGATSGVASATALPPLPGVPGTPSASSNTPTSVILSWAAASDAASYTIVRGLTSGGPYSTLATGVTGSSYTNTGLTAGTTYFYRITAVNAAGTGLPSVEVSGRPSDLRVRLAFDETTGTTAGDAAGGGFAGTLVGGATWSAGRFGNGVDLDGATGQVSLPTGVANGLGDFTAMSWVYLDAAGTWARVFDFGTSTSNYMFLSVKNGANAAPRFAIRTAAVAEQQITGSSPLPTGSWAHVAVTLAGGVGVLYVNGTEVGRNAAMTLTPSSLGATTLNYLGRSQWSADPYLNGRIDDFRLHSRALSATEVRAIAQPGIGLIASSPAEIATGSAAGTAVGGLGTTLTDPVRSFTYALVAGSGAADNDAFTIVGERLIVARDIDYETQSSYFVRIRATDQYGVSLEQPLVIAVAPPPQEVVTVAAGVETVGVAPTGGVVLRKRGPGTLVLDRPGSFTGGTVVEEGVVLIRDPAALGSGRVLVKAGGKVVLDVGAGEMAVTALLLADGARIDLGTGRLTVAADGTTLDDVRRLMISGRADGSWTGVTGFVTRSASAEAGLGLGYLAHDDGSITVGYAAAGDANLDGQIDILDISVLLGGGAYDAASAPGWESGDFNYDGICDTLDIVAMLAGGGFDQGPSIAAAFAAFGVEAP